MFFSSSSNYPIGLDISDLSLKMIQLDKKGNKIRIQALGRADVPEGFISGGEIKNQAEVIKIIKKLINKPKFGRVSTENVVACLPETKTFIKLIEIAKTPNKISDIIEGEIEKHVPLAINEVYYDWQVIREKGDKQDVLIGVAPKDIVNQYTNLLDGAKLSVEALEIEPMCLCRSLLKEENSYYQGPFDKNYALIDFGAKRTSMIVYSKNTILFTVSMPISGEGITLEISESLKIDKGQAEKAKIVCGLDNNKAQGVISKILSKTINDLNKKINKALEFYNNHHSDHGPINKILLCGGGANISGINEMISKSVAIPVEPGNVLVNLGEAKEKFKQLLSESVKVDINFSKKNKLNKSSNKKNQSSSITQDTNLTFATAVGLALRSIFIDKL